MAEMRIIEVAIDSIYPYPDNPRRNDKAVDAVAESIRQFGFKNPIIVDDDYVIISGHTRRLAALKLGLKEVPVYVASDMTPEQVRAFRLADNRVAEIADWDVKLLREEIAKIMTVDLESLGFGKELLEDVLSEAIGVKRHKCPRCGAEWTG